MQKPRGAPRQGEARSGGLTQTVVGHKLVGCIVDRVGDLKPHQKLMLIVIGRHVNDDEGGVAWPSVETVARLTCMSERHAVRTLGELVALGYLTKVRDGRGRRRKRDRAGTYYTVNVGRFRAAKQDADGVFSGPSKQDADGVFNPTENKTPAPAKQDADGAGNKTPMAVPIVVEAVVEAVHEAVGSFTSRTTPPRERVGLLPVPVGKLLKLGLNPDEWPDVQAHYDLDGPKQRMLVARLERVRAAGLDPETELHRAVRAGGWPVKLH